MPDIEIRVKVNGRTRRATVPPRLTLADFLREHCRLTGTHVGCEHGVCGSCTVLLDGEVVARAGPALSGWRRNGACFTRSLSASQ